MCLTNISFDKEKHFCSYKPIKVYKVLQICQSLDGQCKILKSESHNYTWKRGHNHFLTGIKLNKYKTSNIIADIFSSIQRKVINNGGFHVFLNKAAANKYCKNCYDVNMVVVELMAKPCNVLAIGKNNRRSAGAVVTNLYLSKEEYERVIG